MKGKKNRRYYLHNKLKKIGYVVISRKKTVLVPAIEFENKQFRSKISKKYIHELCNNGYAIQSTID